MKLALTLVLACVALGAATQAELIPGKWIVVLKDSAADTVGFMAEYKLQAEHEYKHVFKGFSTTITDDAVVSRLRVDPRVKILEQDQVARLAKPTYMGPVKVGVNSKQTNYSTFPVKQAECSTQRERVDWGLARCCLAGPIVGGVPNIYAYESRAGAGVDAYIIDTGIYAEHSDFGARASQIFKSTPSWRDTDGNGHGTHVASTTGGATWGMAKAIDNLYGVKVLDDGGSGTFAGVIAGVDFVRGRITPAKKAVANLSLGGGATPALDTAINALNDAGCFVASAAGNDNANACNTSPARAERSFTVGATALVSNTDARATYSAYGPCVNIFAPGTNIEAAWIGATTATRVISGTSMASPHVAGAAALLFAMGGSSPEEVKSLLTSYASRDVINLGCTNDICRQSPNLMVFAGCDCG